MVMEPRQSPERRIGTRTRMTPLQIDWRLPDPDRKKRRRADPATESAWIVDVSVTGAAIEAPLSEDLFKGHRVRIGVDGSVGIVVIRRVTPTDNEWTVRYGVEFVDLDPELEAVFRGLLEKERPAGLETRWQRAR